MFMDYIINPRNILIHLILINLKKEFDLNFLFKILNKKKIKNDYINFYIIFF